MDPSMDLGGLLFPYICLTCPRWGFIPGSSGLFTYFWVYLFGPSKGVDEVKNKIRMVNAQYFGWKMILSGCGV